MTDECPGKRTYATWCTETTPAEISAAFRIEDEFQIGFWDALVASAASSGATRILSDDLRAGQRISGVLIENPFTAVHVTLSLARVDRRQSLHHESRAASHCFLLFVPATWRAPFNVLFYRGTL
jgi:hypothetical protein